MTDLELLGEYGRTKAPGAFEELVRRHVDWVYSAAVRQVRNRQLAEDVTQAVFIALAQRAGSLHGDRPLSGWLIAVTRCAAINALRAEGRRRRREQAAAAMRQELAGTGREAEWEEISPVLDEQVLRLKQKDRDAVMLRFYECKSFAEVGQTLGISEEAARKRVDRAVEQLRARMAEKGVTVGAGALAGMASEWLVEKAPAELARHVMTGDGAAAGAIAKGALSMMAWMKVKVAAGILAAAAVAGVGVGWAAMGGGGAVMVGALMQPGQRLSVQVLLPDGTPAAGAEVYLARAGENAMFVNDPAARLGKRGPSSRPSAEIVTGADGRFTLTPEQRQRAMVAIVHAQGVADAELGELASGQVALQPWARIEGQLSAALRTGAGQKVRAACTRMTIDGFGLYYEYETPVDSAGRFVFAKVPPGPCEVSRIVSLTRARTEMGFYDHRAAVVVGPGQGATVNVGGTGIDIRGHVDPPEGSAWKFADAYVELMPVRERPTTMPAGFPADFGQMSPERQKAWLRTWARTAEGKAWLAEDRKRASNAGTRVVNGIRDDGVFDLVEVPPGKYMMMVSVSALNEGPAWGLGKPLGALRQEIVVPDGPAGQGIDLGRFVLQLPDGTGG